MVPAKPKLEALPAQSLYTSGALRTNDLNLPKPITAPVAKKPNFVRDAYSRTRPVKRVNIDRAEAADFLKMCRAALPLASYGSLKELLRKYDHLDKDLISVDLMDLNSEAVEIFSLVADITNRRRLLTRLAGFLPAKFARAFKLAANVID